MQYLFLHESQDIANKFILTSHRLKIWYCNSGVVSQRDTQPWGYSGSGRVGGGAVATIHHSTLPFPCAQVPLLICTASFASGWLEAKGHCWQPAGGEASSAEKQGYLGSSSTGGWGHRHPSLHATAARHCMPLSCTRVSPLLVVQVALRPTALPLPAATPGATYTLSAVAVCLGEEVLMAGSM